MLQEAFRKGGKLKINKHSSNMASVKYNFNMDLETCKWWGVADLWRL